MLKLIGHVALASMVLGFGATGCGDDDGDDTGTGAEDTTGDGSTGSETTSSDSSTSNGTTTDTEDTTESAGSSGGTGDVEASSGGGEQAEILTIDPAAGYYTSVDHWYVNDGGTVEQVAEAAIAAFENDVKGLDGFEGAVILPVNRNAAGTDVVVVYTQWESQAAAFEVVMALDRGELPDYATLRTVAEHVGDAYVLDATFGELTYDTADPRLLVYTEWVPNADAGTTVEELTTAVSNAIRTDIDGREGFLGAMVLGAANQSTVAMFSRWADQAAVDAFDKFELSGQAMALDAAKEIGDDFPGLYELGAVVLPSAK